MRVTLPAGSPLVRIVRLAHGPPGALYFGPGAGTPPAGRFDAPNGAFRVCYLALTMDGAFAESVLRLAPAPMAVGGLRAISVGSIEARGWAWTQTTRDLDLVDLSTGHGLGALNVTASLTAGDSHVLSRQVSATIHAVSPPVDGIRYRPRHAPDALAVALFDRAADALAPVTTLQPLFVDGRRLAPLLRDYQLSLLLI